MTSTRQPMSPPTFRYLEQPAFDTMPVRRAVLQQAIPAVFSQMLALVYNLADTYFVGMLNDPRQSAAITVAASSFLMLTAISNLFGIGGGTLLARYLGAKRMRDAQRVPAAAFWFGLAAASMFSLVYYFLSDPILRVCGSTAETYEYVRTYVMWTVVLGGPFTVLNTLLAHLIRAQGNAVSASIGLSVGGVLNILLDPVFILPEFLGMGVEGAALSTAISNAVGTAYFIAYLWVSRKRTVIDLNPRQLRGSGQYIRKLLSTGMPSAMQYALTVVAVAAQSAFIAKYSARAVAALGIVKKLDNLPLYFSIGIANGILPMLAYSNAAGNERRRRQVFRFGSTLSLSFSLLCVTLYELAAKPLASLFIADVETVELAAIFLRRMVTAMPFMALTYPMIVQFQAIGRTRESLAVSVLRKGVIDIPLLLILDGIWPLYGCLWVQPIVDALALVVSFALYIRLEWRS